MTRAVSAAVLDAHVDDGNPMAIELRALRRRDRKYRRRIALLRRERSALLARIEALELTLADFVEEGS